MDQQSMVSKSVVSQTVKGKRALQIKRLEREYQRLNKRFEQVTDPIYISDLKNRLRAMESESSVKVERIKKMEVEQVLLDKQITK